MTKWFGKESNNRAECERLIQIHQKILRIRAWSAHVTTDELSVVRISQMINQCSDIDYYNIFTVILLNIHGLE